MKYSRDSIVTEYVDMLHSLSCKALISKPTRITEQSSTLIDHIYTNDTKHAIMSGISIFDLSDHLPTFSIVKAADVNITSNNYTVRNMKNLCINDFLFDLYINCNEDSTVNSQYETFVDIFQTVVNNHAPLCNASRKQKRMRQKPWLTPGTYKSILTKNKMYHKVYNITNTPLYNMYKVYRNNLSRIIKMAKQQYYYTLISSNKNDTKKLHQILSDLINLKCKTRSQPSKIITASGAETHDPVEIANECNSFFSKVGERMASNILRSSRSLKFSHYTKFSFFLHKISEQEVQTLKIGRAHV